jgi:uncharacterized protein YggE
MTRKTFATIGLLALAVLVTVGALTAGLGTAGAHSPADGETDRTIGVSATGEASAAPDEAVVRVAVTATGDDPSAVRDDLSADAADLRSALDDLGVTYETSSFRLSEDRRHEERPDAAEYRGVHAFEVTVDDPSRAGAVVDAAAEADASVQQVQLTLSDDRREQLRDRAISNAMDDARQQASTVAAAGDLRVVGVYSVDASERNYRPIAYETAAAGGDGGGSTSIDSGAVSVAYHVSVTYNATAA